MNKFYYFGTKRQARVGDVVIWGEKPFDEECTIKALHSSGEVTVVHPGGTVCAYPASEVGLIEVKVPA
jgi:hypothetical protein